MAAPIITIDGPSGVGKGTTTLKLAQHLQWHTLDSGAIYRVLAFAAHQQTISLADENALSTLAAQINLQFTPNAAQEDIQVYLNQQDVSKSIRTEACGTAASQLAILPTVRQALLTKQRAFHQPPGLVADGRDMGTVVFPNADLKFFLTASIEARAHRRYKQLMQKGIDANMHSLVTEIASRDKRDQERNTAPLIPAQDALAIDTTMLSIEAVLRQMLDVIKEKFNLD